MATSTSRLEERYEILAALPGSSLFAVYSARDRSNDDNVEIRQPRVRALENLAAIEPFRRLMSEYQEVRNQYLSRMVDIAREDEDLWIAYEAPHGDPLRNRLVEGVRLDDALQLIAQAANALEELHQAGLYHGDINSRSLHVLPVGGAQLRGAGLAALATAMGGAMQSSLQIPMPAYMAPELLRGGPPTPQSDIFSLGMVLYETLTGRLPFTGNTRDTVRVKQQESRISPVTTMDQSLPAALDPLISQALAWEPADRFQTAKEMEDALLDLRLNLPAAEEHGLVPEESARDQIRIEISGFEPTMSHAQRAEDVGYRVCMECLTVNSAGVARCAVCWRDLSSSPITDRVEGDALAASTEKSRFRRRWIRRGSIAAVFLILAALFVYDRGAPPGLLTGPPTTNLSALAGPGFWTTPRGGNEAKGSFVQAPVVPQGNERWQLELDAEIASSPTVADGRVFITTRDARILALSADDGSIIWEAAAPGPVDTAAIVAGDQVFVAFRNSSIVSYNAATGEEIWQARLSNPLFSWVIVNDGVLYASCQNGVLQALDAGTGELRWEIDTGGGLPAPPAISEGLLVVPTEHKQMMVLVGLTGHARLIYVIPRSVEGSAAVNNGVAIVAGLDRHVRAVDIRAQNLPLERTVLRWWTQFFIWGMAPFPPAQSGVIWTDYLGEEMRTHPAISGSRAFVSTTEGSLTAYSVGAGEIIWDIELEDEPSIPGSPTVVNNTVFVGTDENNLHAVDARNGGRLWTLPLEGPLTGIPAFADGALFIATENGVLYALD